MVKTGGGFSLAHEQQLAGRAPSPSHMPIPAHVWLRGRKNVAGKDAEVWGGHGA